MNLQGTTASYRTYWIAWFILLVLTVALVFTGASTILVGGIMIKAAIIVLLYMHLGSEKLGLILSVLLGLFATAVILWLLILPDGKVDLP